MASYLEDYLESVEGLPRDFCLILEETQSKDREFQEFRTQVSKKQSTYFKNLKKGVSTEQNDVVPQAVRADYMALLQLINQKIEIAESASDLLDKYFKKLEQDLKTFEQELDDEKTRKEESGDKKTPKRKIPEVETPIVIPKNTPGRKRKLNELESGGEANVDPDEPVYCVCRQVSFGEMVACDDSECPLEWFHYQCVGLTSKPRGTWYCTECMLRRKGLPNSAT